jgi:nucleoside-diphosphate-sugar epimerase
MNILITGGNGMVGSNIKKYENNINNEFLEIKNGFKSVRQFLYVEDFVKIILMFIKDFNSITFDNIILTSDEIKIIDIVDEISNNFKNVQYEIIDKEEGQIKKTCSNELFKLLYPNFIFTDFKDNLKNTIEWFKQNYDIVRK